MYLEGEIVGLYVLVFLVVWLLFNVYSVELDSYVFCLVVWVGVGFCLMGLFCCFFCEI